MSQASGSQNECTPRKRARSSPSASTPPPTLVDPEVGDIVWAKVHNARWWPAVVVPRERCGKMATVLGKRSECLPFVYWFGDGRVNAVPKSRLVDFRLGYKFFTKSQGGGNFQNGVYQATTELRMLQEMDLERWNQNEAKIWAAEGFPVPHNVIRKPGCLSSFVYKQLQNLWGKYNSDDDEAPDIPSPQLTLFKEVRDGTVAFEDICLSCVSKSDTLTDHPLFESSICKPCLELFQIHTFAIGTDFVAFHCCVCMKLGEVIVCSHPECFRAFCVGCIKMKATLGVLDIIREADPWFCFICEPYKAPMHGFLQARKEWKLNVWKLFHKDSPELDTLQINPVHILCCGETCGTVMAVLNNFSLLRIEVGALYLCGFSPKDVDELLKRLPDKVFQLPPLSEFQDSEALSKITPIHFIIASSSEKKNQYLWQSFTTFFAVLFRLRVLNQRSASSSLPLWVYEVFPPFQRDVNTLITRYLEFEHGAWSHVNNNESYVWSNFPALWKFLKGPGLPEASGTVQMPRRRLTGIQRLPLPQNSKLQTTPDLKKNNHDESPSSEVKILNLSPNGETPKGPKRKLRRRRLFESPEVGTRITRSMKRSTL